MTNRERAALADLVAMNLAALDAKPERPLSYREIGELIDVSRETVRNIEKTAMVKIRDATRGWRP